jgi:transcriptional regulator with XRE-family HTH domain
MLSRPPPIEHGRLPKNVRLRDQNNEKRRNERMKTEYQKPPRSTIKRITRELVVLRWMRRSRRISMRRAGAAIGVSSSTISHIEQGRMGLPVARVPELLSLYGYSSAEYEEHVMGKSLPVLNIRDECEQMIARIESPKLKALHAVLLSFLS